jgi:hypothetical protein
MPEIYQTNVWYSRKTGVVQRKRCQALQSLHYELAQNEQLLILEQLGFGFLT